MTQTQRKMDLVRAFSIPKMATREQAMRSMTTHSHHKGIGYVDHQAPLPLPIKRTAGGNDCRPPVGAVNGSAHLVRPPGATSVPMMFRWVAREGAWARPGGHRMAFTAEYLAANGWSYVRPA